MNVAAIRGYLRDTVEFSVYFVFMTVLGAAMYVLVNYAPQANSRWYIDTCIAMALFSAVYAVRMFLQYRRAKRRLALLGEHAAEASPGAAEEQGQTLSWSERLAAERLEARGGDAERVRMLERLEALERAYRGRCAVLGVDPEEEGEAFSIDPNMSLDAIRDRIADRLSKEDQAGEGPAPSIFRK